MLFAQNNHKSTKMLFAQNNHKSTKMLFAQNNHKGTKCHLHKITTKAQNVICTK